MSQIRFTRRLATLGVAGLVTACAVPASSPQPQATTYPVTFPPGSAQLHTADQETIRGVASMMERNPALVARVVGKTDTVGSADYNERLSHRRATAVADVLVHTYKVPARRVEVNWTGERLPIVPTGDSKAELVNRTVDIILR